MNGWENHTRTERSENKAQRSEQHGIQQTARETYAQGAHWQRGVLVGGSDHHNVNREFGHVQIVERGDVVASTHYPNTGAFGGWHSDRQMMQQRRAQYEQHTNFGGWRDGGMALPNPENQTLMHTARRTLGNNWGHQLYSLRQNGQ